MSNWSIYVENSSGGWDSDGTIPRPNENLELSKSSTEMEVKLADGSYGYILPETKSVNEPFSMFFASTTSAFRTQIQNYIASGDKVKIVTHTGEYFITKFLSMKRVWLVGVEDTIDVQIICRRYS